MFAPEIFHLMIPATDFGKEQEQRERGDGRVLQGRKGHQICIASICQLNFKNWTIVDHEKLKL